MTATSVHVAVIADIAHAMVENDLVKRVNLAIKAENPPPPVSIIPSPILNHLHTPEGRIELQKQLNRDNTAVVIAMIGIESSSSYQQDIHKLLDIWSISRRPVLLLSGSPPSTRKTVDSWQGWQELATRLKQDIDTLKQAVIINDGHLLSQGGEKALEQIKKSITVAKALVPILSAPLPAIPSGTVSHPTIEAMSPSRIPTPSLA